ncbi:MAG: DUF1990 domain-containing protein [Acidimicrobiales bacterium]
MEIGGARIGRRSAVELEARLVEARDARPTYDAIGSTHPDRAHGPAYVDSSRTIAGTAGSMDRARQALQTWVAQRGLGAHLAPPDAPVLEGTTLLVVLPAGPIELVAPVRVMWVIDEPDRFGFGYGTLPGHPERGEESFMAQELGDEIVLAVAVDASPASWAARLAGPVGSAVQRRAVRRYLDALAAHAAG